MRYNIAHGLVTAAQNSPTARKITGGLPWREAASVMLVSPRPFAQEGSGIKDAKKVQSENKPHFLVTQRSKTSGSFSSILCFPGGNTCTADQDENWVDRIAIGTAYDITKNNGISFIAKGGEIPLIYNMPVREIDEIASIRQVVNNKFVPKSVSLRIAAIRETFEETGILLCRPNTKELYGKGLGQDASFGVGNEANVISFEDEGELNYWQETVRKDPKQFMEMCDQYNCLPDVNSLVEWNDWLTPNCFGMQRYDTIFFIAILPQSYPTYICPKEVETADWLTPDQVLKDCEERKCKMITPQIYELTRLRSSSIESIKRLMKIRLRLGIQRWCPAYIRARDGYLSVFPGDDLFPEDLKIEVFEPIRTIDKTLDELQKTSFRIHRIEYRSEFDFKIVIKNYKERAGHIYLD